MLRASLRRMARFSGAWSLARAVGVLGKMDVEHPMELILDTPMAAGDVEQPLGRDVFGQEIITHDGRIGALAPQASARGDAPHCSGAGKAVDASQAGIAHDCGPSCFAPIMGGTVDLLGDAALARSRKLLGNRSEQAPAVCLDRQNIVAAALAHRRRKRAGTMQRIGGNDAAFNDKRSSTSKAPAVSLRPDAFCWAKAMRASTAKTLTMCSGVVFPPRW